MLCDPGIVASLSVQISTTQLLPLQSLHDSNIDAPFYIYIFSRLTSLLYKLSIVSWILSASLCLVGTCLATKKKRYWKNQPRFLVDVSTCYAKQLTGHKEARQDAYQSIVHYFLSLQARLILASVIGSLCLNWFSKWWSMVLHIEVFFIIATFCCEFRYLLLSCVVHFAIEFGSYCSLSSICRHLIFMQIANRGLHPHNISKSYIWASHS